MSAASTQPVTRVLRAVLAAAAVLSVGPVAAHDAPPTAAQPLGWRYPFSCCAGYDCRAATKGEILERPEGYVITDTGEVVPMTDRRAGSVPMSAPRTA